MKSKLTFQLVASQKISGRGYALENCLYLIEKAWFIFRCTRASQRKDYEQAVKSWFLF